MPFLIYFSLLSLTFPLQVYMITTCVPMFARLLGMNRFWGNGRQNKQTYITGNKVSFSTWMTDFLGFSCVRRWGLMPLTRPNRTVFLPQDRDNPVPGVVSYKNYNDRLRPEYWSLWFLFCLTALFWNAWIIQSRTVWWFRTANWKHNEGSGNGLLQGTTPAVTKVEQRKTMISFKQVNWRTWDLQNTKQKS